eukprot:CAMPEP_0184708544 /NCGR_PEP_ID=MMETSP0313-20130426/37827_1 /TAXON_ID=2792 /ORGANISM="Porphyridium aerugineum, Strain SAG 1380-2" /LENGTH=327 /DNA_ID=CAMNT_0027170139 /DNA_START=457 /DNA_END=1440 /DNA_ORIENTATION=+
MHKISPRIPKNPIPSLNPQKHNWVYISLALFLDAPCNGYSSGCYGSHNLAGLVIGIIVVPACIIILLISFLVIWIIQCTNDLDDEQPQDSFICLVPTTKSEMAQDILDSNQPGSRLVLVRCAYQKYKLCVYLWEPDKAEGDCVACGGHVKSQFKARVLPCKHTIHVDCLKTHMKRRIQCLACEASGATSRSSFLQANLTSDSIDFHFDRAKQKYFNPQQYTCSFCHDEVRTGSEIRKPLCGHLFHSTIRSNIHARFVMMKFEPARKYASHYVDISFIRHAWVLGLFSRTGVRNVATQIWDLTRYQRTTLLAVPVTLSVARFIGTRFV